MCTKCDDRQWEGWSWTKFWIGKLSNKFMAFLVYMVYMFLTTFTSSSINNLVLYTSTVVTVIFMLAGAIDQAVANAKITAEFKASITKDLKDAILKSN